MGLSRRARSLGEEVRALGVGSESDEVEGTVLRVERLAEDLVSVKAIQGVKVSVFADSLNSACDSMQSRADSRHMSAVLIRP